MKILYGVQCTGNGHLSRSREIISVLKRLGHDVHVIFSGREPGALREVEIFKPFSAFRGLTYVHKAGRVQYLATAANLGVLEFLNDCKAFPAQRFDLAVTDFEPLTSRIARRTGIPLVAIGHQYSFMHTIPMTRGNAVGRAVLRHFAPGDHYVPLHWHHFNQPILPPVLPTGLVRGTESSGRILVYLPFESRAEVRALLRRIPTHEFVVYGLADVAERESNIHWNSYSRAGFLADLMACDGVICNAGFELPSEALQLGKRLLLKPLHGQMEQESNALALVQLKLGHATRRLDGGAIRQWLSSEEPTPAVHYTDVAGCIARWLDGGKWSDITALMDSAWCTRAERNSEIQTSSHVQAEKLRQQAMALA